MGVKKKKVEELWQIAPKFDQRTLREQYLLGKIFNIGSFVESLNTGLVGKILRKGTNYLICVTEENRMFKSWIHDVMEYTEKKADKIEREPGKPNTLVGTTGYLKYAMKMTDTKKIKNFNIEQFINKYKLKK